MIVGIDGPIVDAASERQDAMIEAQPGRAANRLQPDDPGRWVEGHDPRLDEARAPRCRKICKIDLPRLSADREFVQADSLRPLRALVDQNDLGVEPAAGKPRQGRQAGVAPAKDHDPMATHVTNPSRRVSVRRHAGQARTLAVNQTCAFARTSALRLRPMRRVISESDVDAREARQDRSAFHIAACIAQVAL